MLLEKVARYISDKQLIKEGCRVVVGLSGGADSVALIDILRRLGYSCIAAHCNFHLRGDESDRDEAFVVDFCNNRKIELHQAGFDTYAYAATNSLSVEMAARELRYNWFEQLCTRLDIGYLAVAHHQDDSVETVLLNLIRGTGIRGLTGIPPKNRRIVRPLLGSTRSEILAYLQEHNLPYVTDSTNSETLYTRNKIRLEVLPLLEDINPSAKESIARSSEYLAQVSAIYSHYVGQCKQVVFKDNRINIDELRQLVEPKAILFEILSPYGFNSAAVQQIYDAAGGLPGKRFYSDSHTLVKDRGCFVLGENTYNSEEAFAIDEGVDELAMPIGLKIETLKNTPGFEIEKDRNIVYLDKDKLNFPLTLRHWQQGDWFIPFGMKGRKKLSDYFSDNKFTLFDKGRAWILASGNDIVWLVGHRSDNRYRIGVGTDNVLKITLNRL